MDLLELLLGTAPLGDVLHDHHGPERLVAGADQAQAPRARKHRAHRPLGCDDDVLEISDLLAAQRAVEWSLLARHGRFAIGAKDLRGYGVGGPGATPRIAVNAEELD